MVMPAVEFMVTALFLAIIVGLTSVDLSSGHVFIEFEGF